MASTTLPETEAAVEPSTVSAGPELNLLLEWPPRRSRSRSFAIFGTSLALHALFFAIAIQLPSFVHPSEPERRLVVRKIPLYVPRDLLTQRAPNRAKPSKSIDLASLLASPAARPNPAAPAPSRRHFEVPQTVQPVQPAKNAPQITAEAPKISPGQQATVLPPGVATGLSSSAPPPPAPVSQPFQNVGADTPLEPTHKLTTPNSSVQSAIQNLAQKSNSGRLTVSDDNSASPLARAPGANGQMAAQHAAVELESDPQGADFRAYLAHILSIVRANWRHVTPESVRLGTLRGRTVVEFAINRDGSIPKLVIADPSGIPALDSAAIAGLSMSNPLPPLPTDFKGFQVRLAFNFAYNMPSQ